MEGLGGIWNILLDAGCRSELKYEAVNQFCCRFSHLRFCFTCAVSSSTSRNSGTRDHGLLQLRPPRRGRPGWQGSGGGREPSVCFRCDRSGHLAMECPNTADRGSRSGGSVCCRLVQSLAANDPSVFTIKEKAPIRSFSWLKAPNLRHFEDTLLNGNPW